MRVLMVSDVDFPRVTGVSTSRQALAAAGHASVRVAVWPIPRDPEDRLMQPRALAAALDQLNPAGFDLVRLHTRFLAQRGGVRWARSHGRAGPPRGNGSTRICRP